MVGDALLDIIFEPEENDGVGMLIGEVNSSPPGNLLHITACKSAPWHSMGCLHNACSNAMSAWNNKPSKAHQQECS